MPNTLLSEIAVSPQTDYVIRLLCAGFCGAIIGFERKRRQKGAGIKTHLLVAMGAAAFTIISKYGFLDVAVAELGRADVSRVASTVVTGVGFLGAGVIYERNKSITGLTTAAGLWVVAAIGMAFGAGMFSMGGALTGIVALVQYLLHQPLDMLERYNVRSVSCTLQGDESILNRFIQDIHAMDDKTEFVSLDKKEPGMVSLRFTVHLNKKHRGDQLFQYLKAHPHVRSFHL